MKKNFRNIAFNFLLYICHVKQIFKLLEQLSVSVFWLPEVMLRGWTQLSAQWHEQLFIMDYKLKVYTEDTKVW